MSAAALSDDVLLLVPLRSARPRGAPLLDSGTRTWKSSVVWYRI